MKNALKIGCMVFVVLIGFGMWFISPEQAEVIAQQSEILPVALVQIDPDPDPVDDPRLMSIDCTTSAWVQGWYEFQNQCGEYCAWCTSWGFCENAEGNCINWCSTTYAICSYPGCDPCWTILDKLACEKGCRDMRCSANCICLDPECPD